MSRKIRRVPANWQHPTYRTMRWGKGEIETWRPLLDRDFAKEAAEWDSEKAEWDSGTHAAKAKYPNMSYEDYAGERPDAQWYVPYDLSGDLPWWQMYETVTEGTPVTPAFATADELIDFLVEHGQQYEGGDSDGPWPRERAETFVKSEGWFPSFILSGGQFFQAKDGKPT